MASNIGTSSFLFVIANKKCYLYIFTIHNQIYSHSYNLCSCIHFSLSSILHKNQVFLCSTDQPSVDRLTAKSLLPWLLVCSLRWSFLHQSHFHNKKWDAVVLGWRKRRKSWAEIHWAGLAKLDGHWKQKKSSSHSFAYDRNKTRKTSEKTFCTLKRKKKLLHRVTEREKELKDFETMTGREHHKVRKQNVALDLFFVKYFLLSTPTRFPFFVLLCP